MNARRPSPYPPPPPGNIRLPARVRLLSWWTAGPREPARRWARRIDGVVIFAQPLLCLLALLLAVALPYLASSRPTSGSCTLVEQTWSCTR